MSGNEVARLDRIQVVSRGSALRTALVVEELSAQETDRVGFEGLEWKAGRDTKSRVVDLWLLAEMFMCRIGMRDVNCGGTRNDEDLGRRGGWFECDDGGGGCGVGGMEDEWVKS